LCCWSSPGWPTSASTRATARPVQPLSSSSESSGQRQLLLSLCPCKFNSRYPQFAFKLPLLPTVYQARSEQSQPRIKLLFSTLFSPTQPLKSSYLNMILTLLLDLLLLLGNVEKSFLGLHLLVVLHEALGYLGFCDSNADDLNAWSPFLSTFRQSVGELFI
jgi:hypothetical protein